MMRMIVVALLLLLASEGTFAGDRWNIRGVGMGRTVNAGARGIDALGINPAALAYPQGGTVTIGLPAVSVFGRMMIGFDTYQKYFTGVPGPGDTRVARELTEQDKTDLLSQFPDLGKNRIESELLLGALSVYVPSVGGFAFSVSDRIGGESLIPKDYMRIIQGFDVAGSRYDFSETEFSAWWYRELNLSFGGQLPIRWPMVKRLTAGVGLKVVQGYGVVQTDRFAASLANVPDPAHPLQYSLSGKLDFAMRRAGIDLMNDSASVDFQMFPAPAGTGFGVDLGICADVTDGVMASLSVSDIGTITWRRNTNLTHGGGSVDITDAISDAGRKKVENAIDGTEEPTGEFSTPLPTILRLGVRVEGGKVAQLRFLPKDLLLVMDYTQGLNKSLGNTIIPRVSVGAEYCVASFLPVRTGLSVGGGDVIRWAFGFGLDFGSFSLDMATEHFGIALTPRSFQAASVALGMKVRI